VTAMDDVNNYFKKSNNFSKIYSADGLKLLLDIIWERTAIFWVGFISTLFWIIIMRYGYKKDQRDK